MQRIVLGGVLRHIQSDGEQIKLDETNPPEKHQI